MPETVANLVPAGAGRIRDWIWPGFLTGAGSANFDTSCTSRSGSQSFPGTTTGFPPGGNTAPAAVINGVPCVKINCGPGTAGILFSFGGAPMAMYFPTSKAQIPVLGNDEAAYRIVAAIAGSGVAPNANTDIGIEFVRPSGNQRLAQDGVDGWGLRFGAATLEFLANGGPGGSIVQDITPAGIDLTQWHTYDFRILAATPTNNAQLSLLIDNEPVNLGANSSTWGIAGSHLPPQVLSLGVMSYKPQLIAQAGNVNFLAVAWLRFMAAPSLTMCF